MHNLVRRQSGIYALRLSIPKDLRGCLSKTEIIESTGTREIALAKIIAGVAGARWRERFIDLRRLKAVASLDAMTPNEILSLTTGSPALHGASHLPIQSAARASGISDEQLLRLAAERRISLWCRVGRTSGVLLPEDELEPVDPVQGSAGGLVIPPTFRLPPGALPHVAEGTLRVHPADAPAIAANLIGTSKPVECVAFQLPPEAGAFHGMLFAPDVPVLVSRGTLEVAASEVESTRRELAKLLHPDQVEHARALLKAGVASRSSDKGKHSDKPLSAALEHYVEHGLRHKHQSAAEIARISNGCHLLIELDGDVAVGSVTTEQLRHFRDVGLATVPANENKIRLKHKTSSVAESIAAVHGTAWPIMSAGEREKRMRWIGSWFHWLHQQRWISENPAAPLHGESVLSVSERKKKLSKRADEVRAVFTTEDLAKLFSEEWFQTGRGRLTKQGTYREFMPHYYWGPLLALLAGGGRVNEVAQLHLNDFGVTAAGTHYVDFTADAEDKKLKNLQSRRRVPLHPLLISLGLPEWTEALKAAGYSRLFPELKHDPEKGYGKALSKWFTRFMASRGYPRDGTLTFHSFRHTFTNALPADMPDRVRKQFTGHLRGHDSHDTTYRKDLDADQALPYIERLKVRLPEIATFNVQEGLTAVADALRRRTTGS